MYSLVIVLCVITSACVEADITFAALGDWGVLSTRGRAQRQRHVADVMNQWCEENDCDFILGVGDSPIPSRSQPHRFTRAWRHLYGGRAIRHLKWYTSLGGHTEAQFTQQLRYAVTESRWYLPWYYYSFEMRDQNTSAVFYSMDSHSLRRGSRDPERQLSEMQQALSLDAHWTIVFGHHSPLSVGQTPGDETVLEQAVPLCEQHGVDALITGHGRSLQHITGTYNPDMHFVVSGGGGARTAQQYSAENEEVINELGYTSQFFDSTYGFVGVTLSSTKMKIEYFDYKVQGTRINTRLLHTVIKLRDE